VHKNFLYAAFPNAYGLETADGYVPLYPRWYKEFWLQMIRGFQGKDDVRYQESAGKGNYLLLAPRPEVLGVGVRSYPIGEYVSLNFLSLANVRFLVSEYELVDPRLKKVDSQEAPCLLVYENREVLPRAFVVSRVNLFDSADDLLSDLYGAPVSRIRNEVWLEGKYAPFPEGLSSSPNAAIEFHRYSPDEIRLSVELDGTGFLVVTNAYSPFWQVCVNGESKDIVPAYHAFWGVFLEAGMNDVRFEYRPSYRIFR
jgi:hypothetical protein